MKSFKLLTVAVALAMTGVASAATRVDAEIPSVVVQYGDLNLNTQAGVVKLHSRLRSAAQNVCSPLDSRVSDASASTNPASSKAIAQSVAAVGNDSLEQVSPLRHEARGSRIQLKLVAS